MTETVSGRGAGRGAPNRGGLKIQRIFTKPDVHPYDEVTWERRDVVQTNWRTGETVFEQRGVEFPDFWSLNASTIVTTKYFRGAVGTDAREWSLRQLIDRVVKKYRAAGEEFGYFAGDDADIFEHELTWMLLHQVFSFNSPVWFNVGTASPAQVSACFILAVDDTMDSILNWYREEGLIFKGGSGAGLNLSRIRSSKELLSSGGTASGPVSFMRGADASAGTIKSGGATRRAAKMVVLDVDHPDVEEFIETKAREEDKIRALRDAGFDMDLGGKDIVSVQYQNANNSVRVSDEFMRAVEADGEFALRARMTGEVIETVSARDLWHKMAQAAWECADPGIQYDGTINDWHTNPETGRITASNPCSEYLSLDNSSCNLASLNLMKFLREDGTFDAELFAKCVELIITAMDISISFADFPTRGHCGDDAGLPPARHRLRQPRRAAHGVRPGLRLRRRPRRRRGDHFAHDWCRLQAVGRARWRRRPLRRLRPQRVGTRASHAKAPVGQRRAASDAPDGRRRSRRGHEVLGRGQRHRRQERLAQRAGQLARADGLPNGGHPGDDRSRTDAAVGAGRCLGRPLAGSGPGGLNRRRSQQCDEVLR